MSEAKLMIREAAAVRQRLRSPPNAVQDYGIDLRRRRAVPPPVVAIFPEPPRVVLPLPVPQAKIDAQRPAPISVPLNTGTAKAVARVVGEYYGIDFRVLLGEDRHKLIAHARFAAMDILRKITRWSLPYIGKVFGHRDHTTVLYSIRKSKKRAATEFQYGAEIAVLECVIRKGLEKREVVHVD